MLLGLLECFNEAGLDDDDTKNPRLPVRGEDADFLISGSPHLLAQHIHR